MGSRIREQLTDWMKDLEEEFEGDCILDEVAYALKKGESLINVVKVLKKETEVDERKENTGNHFIGDNYMLSESSVKYHHNCGTDESSEEKDLRVSHIHPVVRLKKL